MTNFPPLPDMMTVVPVLVLGDWLKMDVFFFPDLDWSEEVEKKNMPAYQFKDAKVCLCLE